MSDEVGSMLVNDKFNVMCLKCFDYLASVRGIDCGRRAWQ